MDGMCFFIKRAGVFGFGCTFRGKVSENGHRLNSLQRWYSVIYRLGMKNALRRA